MRRCIEAVRGQRGASTYPLAACVARGEDVLALECSRLPEAPDPTAHPEITAIRAAAARAGSRYLPGTVLYSTVEPCPMCAAAAVWARMDGIVFGATLDDMLAFARTGASAPLTWRQIAIPAGAVVAAGEPRLWVIGGILRAECLALLDLTAERAGGGPDA